eukprot:101093-Prymnesium_polylepis.1
MQMQYLARHVEDVGNELLRVRAREGGGSSASSNGSAGSMAELESFDGGSEPSRRTTLSRSRVHAS